MHEPAAPSGPDGPRRPVSRRAPSPGTAQTRLTHADRDAAAERLKEAFAAGQLDENEFDERLDLAMAAKFPADVEPLLADLTPEPAATAGAPAEKEQETAWPRPQTGNDRVMGAAGHVSGYFLSALGPLLVLLVSGKHSDFVRRHATEALNYQITVLAGSIVLIGLSWLILPAIAWVLMMLGWVFMPAIAGLLALFGGRWRYPFTWRPVRYRPRTR